MDILLGRLTDVWEISQPPHLRHLSIVRDTSVTHRAVHYLYRTFGNFQDAVANGEASWEDALTKYKSIDKLPTPKLDRWGFAISFKHTQLEAKGAATLTECARAYNDAVYHITERDPQLVPKPDGTVELQWFRTINGIVEGGVDAPRVPRPTVDEYGEPLSQTLLSRTASNQIPWSRIPSNQIPWSRIPSNQIQSSRKPSRQMPLSRIRSSSIIQGF